MKSRREFLKTTGLAAAGSLAMLSLRGNEFVFIDENMNPFSLPKLPYAFNALEPFIDAQTMQIHYSKHHQAYVDKLNEAVFTNKIENPKLLKLLERSSSYPASIRNNAGGHYNHTLFWNTMKPAAGVDPPAQLAQMFNQHFGGFDKFKEEFTLAAKSVFGSGWCWLIKTEKGNLQITTTPNQDNPLMDVAEVKGIPLLGLDVWEHAYYLKHQNMRADYIAAWWNVVNWDEVLKFFLKQK